MQRDKHDPKSAEFIRTFRTLDFPGGLLARRLEAETAAAPQRKARRVLPDKSKESNVYTKFFEDMYGYRGRNQKLYFLSPWEFMMLWECLRLPRPKKHSHDSTDSEGPGSMEEDSSDDDVPLTVPADPASRPGKLDFDVSLDAEQSDDIAFFPILGRGPELRWTWYMRRRRGR